MGILSAPGVFPFFISLLPYRLQIWLFGWLGLLRLFPGCDGGWRNSGLKYLRSVVAIFSGCLHVVLVSVLRSYVNYLISPIEKWRNEQLCIFRNLGAFLWLPKHQSISSCVKTIRYHLICQQSQVRVTCIYTKLLLLLTSVYPSQWRLVPVENSTLHVVHVFDVTIGSKH